MLEVDVLVVVVVVIAVDPVVDVRYSVKDGEGHSGKHQGNKLKLFITNPYFVAIHYRFLSTNYFNILYSSVGSRGREFKYKVCSSLS